jgi:chorismate mutase
LKRRYPDLPVICDPSHIGGSRDLILPLCQQAMDLNFDGLIVETHCNPDEAWSDAAQQVTPARLKEILGQLVIRDGKRSTEDLSELRKQIDELDDQLLELLAKRMRVSQEIGTFKKEHNLTIVQTDRYDEILSKRISQATKMGMNPEFMRVVLEAIHEESVRQQIEIMNK